MLKQIFQHILDTVDILENKQNPTNEEMVILHAYCGFIEDSRNEWGAFEDYLSESFSENNPEILDDDLPDATAEYIGDLSLEEIEESLRNFIS